MVEDRAIERLAKVMARRGLCSRREAETLIESKQVIVDDKLVDIQGVKVPINCDIQILKEGQESLYNKVTIILHKPVGIVSHLPEQGQIAAYQLIQKENCIQVLEDVQEFIKRSNQLSVAGRLDRASRGLLVLTEDGRVVKAITQSRECIKTYEVVVQKAVSEQMLTQLNGPIYLKGKRLLPMQVSRISDKKICFKLKEGKKHQIRKVCRQLGLVVLDLFRTSIGPLDLYHLGEGKWRKLDRKEVNLLIS